MSGIIILILIVVFVLAWPRIWGWLRPYAARWAQRRAEDALRRAMGMPPREKRRAGRAGSGSASARNASGRRRQQRRQPEGPIIPKEYAVDVDFTEIHSYSDETVISDDSKGNVEFRTERQVSDAEIIEIRRSPAK